MHREGHTWPAPGRPIDGLESAWAELRGERYLEPDRLAPLEERVAAAYRAGNRRRRGRLRMIAVACAVVLTGGLAVTTGTAKFGGWSLFGGAATQAPHPAHPFGYFLGEAGDPDRRGTLGERGSERDADTILAAYDRLHVPFPATRGASGIQGPESARARSMAHSKCALALELLEVAPEHSRVGELLDRRWSLRVHALDEVAGTLAELEAFLAGGVDDYLRALALRAHAHTSLLATGITPDEVLGRIEVALDANPGDERLALDLVTFSQVHLADPELQDKLTRRALALAPESAWVRAPAQNLLRKLGGIGKPVDLEFVDVCSGESIDIATLEGQVVWIHAFHGELAQDRPEVEALRAVARRFADLRILGVHNYPHERGAPGLRDMVDSLGFPGPVHDDMLFENGSFSDRWSIFSTPVNLLVSREGKLVAVSHRVAPLERRLRDELGRREP